MPCGHLKALNIQAELLHLEELYAGVHVFIQVLSAPFGQNQGVVNVMSFLPVHLVQVCLVLFYVHWS